jgi:hypothetical protein
MSRKPGDGKKVILGRGAIDYDFPPDSVWVSYESKIGRKLSSALRDKLTVITMTFAMGAYGSPVTTTELKSSIDLWKRRTQILRNQIGPSAGSKDGPKKLTRRSFREQFDLNKLKKPLSYNEPLVFLKFILDAAVTVADVTLKEISSSKYAGARETEMWSVWVALLILALQRHGIPILRTYSSGKHRIEPAFIDFVEALQKTLPMERQRRRKKESLKKGIQDVTKLIVDADYGALYLLLFGWSILHRPSFHKELIRLLQNDPLALRLTSVVERYSQPVKERRKTGNDMPEKID